MAIVASTRSLFDQGDSFQLFLHLIKQYIHCYCSALL